MKRRLLFATALLTAIFFTSTAVAQTQNYDFSAVAPTGQTLYYRITNSSTHAVIVTHPNSSSLDTNGWNGFTKPTGTLTIPDSVLFNNTAYTVTAIGSEAFYNCRGLTGSLTIPNTVTIIDYWAFRDCTGFTGALTIPNSVTYIGAQAFSGCSGLTGQLTIPSLVTSIGNYTFYNCSGLTGPLTIPNSVTSIGACAFYNCSGLTGPLTIPNSVTSIGANAFSWCSGLTGSLAIPNSVTSIGEAAFRDCSGLSGSLTISNSVTSIGNWAFYNCSGLTGPLTIPNSVTSIGSHAFSNCRGFSGSLTIPNSVTSIGAYAFCYCGGLSGQLIIPNSITSIGDYVFCGCGFTGSLIIPNSITSIGASAFSNCSGLSGSLSIPNSVTSIGANAFSWCSGLTGSLTIGDSVTYIGDYAFAYCSSLTDSLTIGNSVTSIGPGAFQNCQGLANVIFKAESFYDAAYTWNPIFSGCSSLTNIYFSNNVKRIPDYLCYNLSNLASVTIGDSVVYIGNSAFYRCRNLTPITIPNSVDTIGSYAFNGCYNLTSITSLATVPPTLGYNVFYYTRNLYVPCGAENAYRADSGWSVFEDVTGINGNGQAVLDTLSAVCTSGQRLIYIINCNQSGVKVTGCIGSCTGALDIPSSVVHNGATYNVTAIGGSAFRNRDSITSLTIPNTITSIGNHAFYYCDGLTSVTIGNSVDTIGDCAFYGCSRLTSVIIPNSVTTIGNSAFDDCYLTSVTSLAIVPPMLGNDAFDYYYDYYDYYDHPENLYIPCGTENAYRAASGWSNFGDITGFNSTFSEVCTTGQRLVYHVNCDQSSVKVSGCIGTCIGAVAIPNNVVHNGTSYSVTSIGNYAFSGQDSITSLSIPNSVTSIGNFAFKWCAGISGRLSIPNSIMVVGNGAFYGCYALTDIISLATTPPTLGDSAFSCGIVYVPCGAEDTYRSANGWRSYDIQGTSLNGEAVLDTFSVVCVSDQRLMYIVNCDQSSVKVTGCIGSCTGALNIPSSVVHNGTAYNVTAIGNRAFYYRDSITSLSIPNTVTVIGNYAFYGCADITSVTIGNSVTTIGYGAFADCNNLTSVTIPNSVTTIGYEAFAYCDSLSSLTIGSSVNTIGDYAYWSGSLTAITSLAIEPPAMGYNVFYYADNVPLYVPCGSEAAYCAADGWSSYDIHGTSLNGQAVLDTFSVVCATGQRLAYRVNCDQSGVRVTGCIGSCSGILDIPSSVVHNGTAYNVTAIGNRAFYYRDSITSLAIPNTVTFIGNYALYGCADITSVTIGNSVITIGDYAFYECYGLTYVTIPNSVTTIGHEAFADCGSLSSLTIGSSVNTIGDYAFNNWSGSLTDITSLAIEPPAMGYEVFSYYDIPDTVPLYVPCGSEAAYRAADGWRRFGNIRGLSSHSDTTVSSCDSYTWATHGSSTVYTTSGIYTDTYNGDGCNRADTLHLTIYADSSTSYTVTETASYTWNNHDTSVTYTQSGTYTHSYTTANGCASVDTLHLTITGTQRTFTVRAASANSTMGSASVVGNSSVQQGAQGTVQAIANSGYRFVRWSNGATANPYTFTVTRDTLLTAIFEGNSYTITIVNGNPDRGIVSGSGTAAYGSRRNIAAAPNHGYIFSHWSDGDSNASRILVITRDVTLTAYFGIRQFHVAAQPANYAQGSVSGGGDYDYQTYATLTATPRNGYVFHHWSDGDTLNPRRLQVTRDTSLTAYFVQGVQQYTLTVVSANPTMGSTFGGGTYEAGTTATIRAAANNGYEFDSWTDGVTSNPRNVTILSDTTFTATFRATVPPDNHTYTISVMSSDENLGRVSGGGIYEEGTTVHIAAYPAAHCLFRIWSDGSTSAHRTITVSGNMSLVAIFSPDSATVTARANDDRMGHVEGGGKYAIGSTATLRAVPNSGYRFVRWRSGETESTISVVVQYNLNYTAIFESTTQGIDEADDTELRVWSHAMTIHVAGLAGEAVKVYDVTGRLVAERTAAHGDMVIHVAHPGLYLVQTGTATHKVLTR